MTITIRTKLSPEQRRSLLEAVNPDKIGVAFDDKADFIVSSSLDSTTLINALDRLKAAYDIVNNEEVVHTFRHREDFKLAGNLNLFPLTFTPGF